jgi:hypothetical protein
MPQSGESEREHGARVEAVGEEKINGRDDQEVVRPPIPEDAELLLDIGQIGGEEQRAQDQHVVRREVRRHRLAPGKVGRSPKSVDEAGERRGAQRGRDYDGAEAVVVVLDELADAGHRDQDADVQKRFELGPDGNELATRHAEKRRGAGLGQDALLAQAGDGDFDFGVDGGSLAPGERPGFA